MKRKSFIFALLVMLAFAGCESPVDDVNPKPNPDVDGTKIFYTSTDGNIVEPYQIVDYRGDAVFDANIISNYYKDGMGVITFDSNLTTIGDGAFYYCTNLESITMPNSVTSIGRDAFANCMNLGHIVVPESVVVIKQHAFRNCWDLVSVSLPDNVTFESEAVFGSCTNLTRFVGKYASYDGRSWVVDGRLMFVATAGITEYTIPMGVTSVGEYALTDNCANIAKVTISDSVMSIDGGALMLPNVEEFCGKYVHDDGRSVIMDGELRFFASKGVTEYDIPNGVTAVGCNVFASSSLERVGIPSSVVSIAEGAFRDSDSLLSIAFPGSVKSIGMGVLLGCDNLVNVTLPNGLTKIEQYMLSFCKSLETITIPESVAAIDYYAFGYCSSLVDVYCKATTPPVGAVDMFADNAPGRKIYVPTESVEAYKSAEGWSEYADAIVGYDF